VTMSTRLLMVAVAAIAMTASGRAYSQRRGEAMKVTAADEEKATVTPTDEGFVRGASGAYQMGSKLAMMAAVRATDNAIKRQGSELVRDFIDFGARLKPAASGEKGYQWSADPSPDDQKTLDALSRLSGHALDSSLKIQLVALFERLGAVFGAEFEKGRDPDLKPVAQWGVLWSKRRLADVKTLGDDPLRTRDPSGQAIRLDGKASASE
jgi:hypothetical protein